ncbi:hypothetical protein GP486_005423 [Trichoglossum hirsutum]|uniref:Major facilitator superfamily (MFS) profile domain-containing protein n=1 Tax=Trichoglossum hirsutum TaxID=265104 RepID=A0A9P8L996_9PEZI|nr:hypothetical protein GP486_005423 [Trichoglossum hirsutum]
MPNMRASNDAGSDVSSATDQSVTSEKLERYNLESGDARSVLDGVERLATPTDPDIEMGGVLAHKSTKSSWRDPGPPPDGGIVAWTQVVMVHLVVFNTWGCINSFGVFQTYYVNTLGRPPSDISWVGSMQIFLVFFIGTFSGRATDAGYFHLIFSIGTALQAVGIFATSFASAYWQLFLSQGVCQGLASGLLFCPTLALLSTYFSKKRGIALGIVASGSATGGLVFPAIVEQLLPRIGFPWTVRVIGFIAVGTLMIVNTFMKTRLPPRRAGPLVEWAAFKEVPYVLFSIGMFLMFLGIYFAFYYIGSFGRAVGLSTKDSITLLLIMNGVGIVGRLVPNYAADRWFGPLNTMIPSAAFASVVLFCWIPVQDSTGLTVFSVLYGLFAAGVQSLFPATLSALTTDMGKMGVRMGMVFSIISFASLIGPPIAGALIQQRNGGYLYAQIYAGSVVMCGCLMLVATRIAKVGLKLRERV